MVSHSLCQFGRALIQAIEMGMDADKGANEGRYFYQEQATCLHVIAVENIDGWNP